MNSNDPNVGIAAKKEKSAKKTLESKREDKKTGAL